ncbi:MAG: YecA family protein [Magnetospirillum sp.]|nr:MAG: YecA family protein [Magnetospirillum sp.]
MCWRACPAIPLGGSPSCCPGTGKAKAMPKLHDLEADMEALDEFLMSDQSPPDCMMLCDLDGFLTGIAIGPELIMPSEWLPVVWGGEEPVFDDAAQAQAVIGTIMTRYNEILGQVADGAVAPIIMETPGGDVIAADWAEGFMQAVSMRPFAWEKLFSSEKDMPIMLPIMALCCDEDGEPLLSLPQDVEDRLFAEAGDLIPACVLDIADYWRATRTAPLRQSAGPKTGRNDPCPCGSGKKYKRCCGAN